jgi:hypothetical protein
LEQHKERLQQQLEQQQAAEAAGVARARVPPKERAPKSSVAAPKEKAVSPAAGDFIMLLQFAGIYIRSKFLTVSYLHFSCVGATLTEGIHTHAYMHTCAKSHTCILTNSHRHINTRLLTHTHTHPHTHRC